MVYTADLLFNKLLFYKNLYFTKLSLKLLPNDLNSYKTNLMNYYACVCVYLKIASYCMYWINYYCLYIKVDKLFFILDKMHKY